MILSSVIFVITLASVGNDIGAVFMNPERGAMDYCPLNTNSTTTYLPVINSLCTLCYAPIFLNETRTQEISSDILTAIRNNFQTMEKVGIKAIVRIVYDDSSNGVDTTLEWIETHLSQLQPVFQQYHHVIAWFQAGIIGAYGEWHGSVNGLDSAINRTLVWNLLLTYLPTEGCPQIQIRRPDFMLELEPSIVNASSTQQACTGASRISHHNDCWLSSDSDSGTYVRAGSTELEAREYWIPILGNLTRNRVWGGEACAVSSFSTCSQALEEAEQLHATYLNRLYNPNVLAIFQTEGCNDTMARQFGYRLVLRSTSYPTEISANNCFNVSITIANIGWAPFHNYRPVYIRLLSSGTIDIDGDSLDWEIIRNVTQLTDPQGDHGSAVGDLLGLWIASDGNYLYMRIFFSSSYKFFEDPYFHITFDTDNNPTTGFDGSELFIEGSTGYVQKTGVFNAGTVVGEPIRYQYIRDGDVEARIPLNWSCLSTPCFPSATFGIRLLVTSLVFNLAEELPDPGYYEYSIVPTADEVLLEEQVTTDPRTWSPESEIGAITLSANLRAPSNVSRYNNLSLALWLPDQAVSLRSSAMFSARFANQSMWRPSAGHNIFASNIPVVSNPNTGLFCPSQPVAPSLTPSMSPSPSTSPSPTPSYIDTVPMLNSNEASISFAPDSTLIAGVVTTQIFFQRPTVQRESCPVQPSDQFKCSRGVSPILGYTLYVFDSVNRKPVQLIQTVNISSLQSQNVSFSPLTEFRRCNQTCDTWAVIPFNRIGYSNVPFVFTQIIEDLAIPEGRVTQMRQGSDSDADWGEIQTTLEWFWNQTGIWSEAIPTFFRIYWSTNSTSPRSSWIFLGDKQHQQSNLLAFSISESTRIPPGSSGIIIEGRTPSGPSIQYGFISFEDVGPELGDLVEHAAVVVSAVTASVAVAVVVASSVSVATTTTVTVTTGVTAGASAANATSATSAVAASTTTTSATSGTAAVGGGTGGGGAATTTTTTGTGTQNTTTDSSAMMIMMIGQYQFLDISAKQSGTYPENYRGFARGFTWSNGNIGFPNPSNRPSSTSEAVGTSRMLSKTSDIPNWNDFGSENLLQNVSFVFVILMGALLFVILLYVLLKSKRLLPELLRRHQFRWEILLICLRLCYVAYFALTFSALLQLRYGHMAGWHAVSIIFLVVITAGLPLATCFALYHRWISRLILASDNRFHYTFGMMFRQFRYDRDWFSLVILVKLFVVACCMAFLADRTFSQSIGVFVVYCGYSGFLFCRPYQSRSQLIVDCLMTAVDVLTVLVPILTATATDFMTDYSLEVGWVLISLQGFVILLQLSWSLGHSIRAAHTALKGSKLSRIITAFSPRPKTIELADLEAQKFVSKEAKSVSPEQGGSSGGEGEEQQAGSDSQPPLQAAQQNDGE